MKKRITKITYDPADKLALGRLSDGVQNSLQIGAYDFTRYRTSATAIFETKKEVIQILPGGNELAGRGAQFVGKVKRHFKQLRKPDRLSTDRPFFEYFVPISTYQNIADVVEIDINGAYWESAHKLGYLPRDLYKEADSVKKKVRLIALGVLGKKTVVTEFKHPYNDPKTREEYADTRIFWDNIVYNLGESMREVTAHYKPHIFGIWFDAIFCTRQSANNIRRFLQRRGYETKVKPIRSYIITPRSGITPGAKIERIFMDGTRKEAMDVTYRREGDCRTLEDFLDHIG